MTEPCTSYAMLSAKLRDYDWKAVTGTDQEDLRNGLWQQMLAFIIRPGDLTEQEVAERASAAVAALAAIRPQDGMEGMLAVQMVAVHSAAMDSLTNAMKSNQSDQSRDMYYRNAGKLMTMYLHQIEAIDRRRGKGVPKVNVEHVTVQSGGQAIVGAVEAQRPRNRKKVGARSPARALEHRPIQALDIERQPARAALDERSGCIPVDVPSTRRGNVNG